MLNGLLCAAIVGILLLTFTNSKDEASSQELAKMAERLQALVGRFKLQ